MKSQHKKIVAFLRFSLDTVGENFIYEEGRHFKKYSPLVLCGIAKRADENIKHYCYREFFKLYQRQWPELPQGCGDVYRSGISKYRDIIKRLPVRILHAQFLTDAYFCYPLVKECGIPLIVNLRGYDLFHPGIKIFLSTVLPFTSKFVVKSKSMKDVLASYGCDPGMIEVVYGGIDTEKIIFKPRVPVKNKIRILSAGRFVEKKGYDVTLKFFSELLKDNPEAQLTLVGEGELGKDLIKKIRHLGIAVNVQIKGYMPHALFIKELYRHNLFVLPSRKAENGDQEGIPNVLKEAMASGMPVISTYHSGIPELIHDRKTGYLVQENDYAAILDRLRVVMADKEEALLVCSKARSAVEKKFQVKDSAAKIERLYDALLEGPMKKKTPGDSQGHVSVSVIIPTFNGEQRLLLLLMSLKNQTDKNFEVIVVDDGSTDGTRKSVARVIKSFPVPLHYYYIDNTDVFGAGQARNYGAKQAKGDVLLFLDQDCVAACDLIKKHSDHHQANDVVLGYYAGYTDEEKCYDFTKLKDYVQQKKAVPVMKEFRDGLFTGAPVADAWKCFVSAHFSIKKEIFHEIHFDESFTQWGCEDIDLGYRLFQAGKAIYFVKDCIVYNSSESRRRTKKKFLTLCESLIAMYKKYQTDEVRLYCFERFYHTPLKYRKSLQLIFQDNRFEVRKSQTDILILKNNDVQIVLGKDFLKVKDTMEKLTPLVHDVYLDIRILKELKQKARLEMRDDLHQLIQFFRDNKKRIFHTDKTLKKWLEEK
jgi:glycosyltransferase involved in cell wall biosynthesis